MNGDAVHRATLVADIPPERYRVISIKGSLPKAGDSVVLDQGFTGMDGQPMVLVYFSNEAGTLLYEAEVYESELE